MIKISKTYGTCTVSCGIGLLGWLEEEQCGRRDGMDILKALVKHDAAAVSSFPCTMRVVEFYGFGTHPMATGCKRRWWSNTDQNIHVNNTGLGNVYEQANNMQINTRIQ